MMLQEKDVKELRQMFEKLDSDKKGILTPYEISDSAEEILGELGFEDSEWK